MASRKTYKQVINSSKCVYCLSPAQCREHFLPHAVHDKPWVLPACNRCNSFLGAKWHYTLRERCEFLMDAYRHRYRKDLTPDFREVIVGTTGALRDKLIYDWGVKIEIEKRIGNLRLACERVGDVILRNLAEDENSKNLVQDWTDTELHEPWDSVSVTVAEKDEVLNVLPCITTKGLSESQIRSQLPALAKKIETILTELEKRDFVVWSKVSGWRRAAKVERRLSHP